MQCKQLAVYAAAAAALWCAQAVQAEEFADNRWYAAPFGTFIKPGGDRDSNDGWGGGLGFGKILDKHFNVEMRGFYQGFGGDSGNWDLTGGTLDLQYHPFRNTFSPYTVLGLGAMNSSHGGDSGTGFLGEAGVGFTYEILDNLLLRSDVRYRYNNNFNAKLQSGTDEFHDMVVNLGVVIPFGAKPAQPVAQAEPLPEPVPAPVVADCSAQDSDHDGINDCDDKCPNTLSNVPVTKYGCWVVDVKFDNDKDIIKPQYYQNLDNAAEAIRNHPEAAIEVQGHTSHTGTFNHNMDLSERRAKAVKNYLLRRTPGSSMTSRGYGWTRPIDTNETEAGRANNRRVQLEIDGKLQSEQ